jgi:thioester reductase-like protein
MKTNADYLLMTGVTGQIGRYLLRDLLVRGRELAVLVRPNDHRSGQQRLERIIAHWEQESDQSLPRPVCLEGDVRREHYGLNAPDRAWLRAHCRTLLHNASVVGFGGVRGQIWEANVAGARQTLRLCRDARIEHLAYVSTAYTCGWQTETVYEDQVIRPQAFRNEYEHSKFEAERLFRESAAFDQFTMLRPAIVVGDYHTGYTRTFHHFYRLAQFNSLISNIAARNESGRFRHDIRLSLRGDESRNFVTLDWVSAAIAAIMLEPAGYGRTYHLTPPQPSTSAEVEEAMQRYFQYDGARFVGNVVLAEATLTPDERRFYEYFRDYEEYWRSDPEFDRRNTDQATRGIDQPRVDVDCMLRLIDYAVRNRFGRDHRRRSANAVRATHGE